MLVALIFLLLGIIVGLALAAFLGDRRPAPLEPSEHPYEAALRAAAELQAASFVAAHHIRDLAPESDNASH